MDPIYPRFAAAHPDFYDEPRRRASTATTVGFDVDPACDWSEWGALDDGHWAYRTAPRVSLPTQGWKIHVSSTPANAQDVLHTVSRYCHHVGVSFKHLSDLDVLRTVDSKDGDRSSAGKFITVYPVDEGQLHDALVDLDGLIGGTDGPYVLSDLRWNAGPIFVRYGAFSREFAQIDGEAVAGLRNLDGELVEDVRSAQFVLPSWVEMPPFLRAQQMSVADDEPPPGFPRVTRALHHSNAGGVYEAVDADGETVVLKEARPWAGLTPDGRDAVARLRDEARVLARIDNRSVVKMRRVFVASEHHFLVMDRVEGDALNTLVASRHPLVRAGSTRRERLDYRDWALLICNRIESALSEVHAAGYTHGDLHPANVMVDGDDNVTLLDFEMARPVGDEAAAIIGAPGFVPRDRRGGVALDRYALACLRLFMFAPLTPLLTLDPQKARDLVRWARDRFDLSASWARSILSDLNLGEADGASVAASRALESWWGDAAANLDRTIEQVTAALHADLDVTRHDRAWAGDPAQFVESPVSLAHGAAGVLTALHEAGSPASPDAYGWFAAAVERELLSPSPRLGLYDGLAGTAWAQRRLGLHAQADRTIDRLRLANMEGLGTDVRSGLAGIGMFLLEESAADHTLLPLVADIGERVQTLFTARQPRTGAHSATDRGGMLRGSTGIALFAARLYAVTEDEAHLALAEAALEDDLAVCIWAPDGSLQINEGWRTMPYLGSGSAGLGLALAHVIALSGRGDDYRSALDGIRSAASAELVVNSGLFNGRAGLVHTLLSLGRAGFNDERSDRALSRHVHSTALHALRTLNGIGFPGQALLRRSCDLATGAAGVLSALIAYRDFLHGFRRPSRTVPFLDLPPNAQSAASVVHDLARTR